MPPLPRVSCYNTALSYKGDAASYTQYLTPPQPPYGGGGVGRCLRCTQWSDRQNSHITLSTLERKKGMFSPFDYSRVVTCAFFTNLARWKFSYENRLVEISRESYESYWWPRRNFAKILIHTKLEWMGYRMVKKAWQYVQLFLYNTSVWQNDGRTSDGRPAYS